jgi:hypothetical protein
MSEADSRGKRVANDDDCYRAITTPEWLDFSTCPPSVRSSAFNFRRPFSVNVASLMSLVDAVRHMCDTLGHPEGGIAQFNCGFARSKGFDPRHEPDPNHPKNKAHANVYFDGTGTQRKKSAKALAQECTLAHVPGADLPSRDKSVND